MGGNHEYLCHESVVVVWEDHPGPLVFYCPVCGTTTLGPRTWLCASPQYHVIIDWNLFWDEYGGLA